MSSLNILDLQRLLQLLLCQGLFTLDISGISVGCPVAVISLVVAFGIYLDKLMMRQIVFSSTFDLVLAVRKTMSSRVQNGAQSVGFKVVSIYRSCL